MSTASPLRLMSSDQAFAMDPDRDVDEGVRSIRDGSEVASYRCELWSKPLLRWRELRTQRLSSTGMRTMSLKVLRCMAMLLRILLVLMASATMT